MKSCLVIFITALFSLSINAQHHKQFINVDQNSNVDSVLFYLQRSTTTNGIDTLLFSKGIDLIYHIRLDDNSINLLDQTAEEFRGIGHSMFCSRIQIAIMDALDNAREYYKEIDYSKTIIDNYDATHNPEERQLFLYTLANLRIPFRVSDKLEEGFDYFTSKLKLYLQRNDSAAISICYFVHGGFYATKGLDELSIYYYKKSIPYLNVNDTSDASSVVGRSGWKNNTSVVGQIYNELEDYKNAIVYSRSALKYGFRTRTDTINSAYIYKNIAYAKMMLNENDSVILLLNRAIQASELADNKISIANCYLVKGIFYLNVNQLDSSELYLNQCNKLIAEYHITANSTEGTLMPNYYLALGRIKQNRLNEAVDLLKAEIPYLINLREEQINEYKLLLELYLELGDIKNANETYRLYTDLNEQLKADERNGRTTSFETEQKIAEAENIITNLENEKQVASLTRNYLLGIAGLLLVIAVFIYNRFKVKRDANLSLEEKNKIILLEKANVEKEKMNVEMEKERSDNLLLNILPEEVAEELKQTGAAKAKAFTLATVMFTDFKDFTTMSEKVSAELLVDEIHTCFSAFDAILQKHKIEKIKTIGDAYMCASGLPVPNYTHATDMVQAAFEIRDYMLKRKKEKEAKGEIPFVLRIGIHTGPVVAGIVGIKKFAYDIWGDTVNIASRMESSGEVGKVNISGSTYELVRDQFSCIHKGKIHAKNKGEIDMYFAEPLN